MNKEEEKKKIEIEPDYIYCPSAENSLEKFIAKHQDGVNDDKVAQVLLSTTDEIKKYYEEALELIRADMKVELDEEDEPA